MRQSVAIIFLALMGMAAWGCTAPHPRPLVTDPDPSAKIPGIKKAVAQKHLAAAEQLIQDLASDDPAVRFYAIAGLERLTGQRLGYDYYGPENQRQAAIEQWKQWLRQQQQQRGSATITNGGPTTATNASGK